MEIPKLRRLPVIWDDFEHIDYKMSSESKHYKFEYELDSESLRLLKLGFIQDEIVCYEHNWLYYFDARSWSHGPLYKFRIDESEGKNPILIDMWQPTVKAQQFEDKFNISVAKGNIERAIRNIRSREKPLLSTSEFHRKPQKLMTEYERYQIDDLKVEPQEFYKLIWGFLGQSQDDKWMSWFNFETGEFNIHRVFHCCQMKFDKIDGTFHVVEIRVGEECQSFNLDHWKSMIPFFLSLNHYRYELVT